MTESAVVYPVNGDDCVGIMNEPNNLRGACVFVVGGPQYRVGSHRQYVKMARRLANDGIGSF